MWKCCICQKSDMVDIGLFTNPMCVDCFNIHKDEIFNGLSKLDSHTENHTVNLKLTIEQVDEMIERMRS